MSTILDALRRLQREQEAAGTERDLRDSVTTEIPEPRARRGSRAPLWLVGAGVALLAAGGAGYWWMGQRGAAHDEPVLARAVAPPVARPDARPRVARPLPAPPAHPAAAPQPQEPLPAAPLPPPPAPAAVPAQPPEPPAAAPPPAPAAAPAARPEPPAAPPAPVVPAPAAQTAKAGATPAVRPARISPVKVATPAPAPEPAAAKPQAPRPAPEPEAKRAAPAPAQSRPAEPAPEPRRAAPPPVDLPDLSVIRLRWHPDARRRSAELQLETRPVEDAREGDIIAGLVIEEIRPDAIVVRVGDARHRIPLEP